MFLNVIFLSNLMPSSSSRKRLVDHNETNVWPTGFLYIISRTIWHHSSSFFSTIIHRTRPNPMRVACTHVPRSCRRIKCRVSLQAFSPIIGYHLSPQYHVRAYQSPRYRASCRDPRPKMERE